MKDKICVSKTLTYLVALVAVVVGAFYVMNYANTAKVGSMPKAGAVLCTSPFNKYRADGKLEGVQSLEANACEKRYLKGSDGLVKGVNTGRYCAATNSFLLDDNSTTGSQVVACEAPCMYGSDSVTPLQDDVNADLPAKSNKYQPNLYRYVGNDTIDLNCIYYARNNTDMKSYVGYKCNFAKPVKKGDFYYVAGQVKDTVNCKNFVMPSCNYLGKKVKYSDDATLTNNDYYMNIEEAKVGEGGEYQLKQKLATDITLDYACVPVYDDASGLIAWTLKSKRQYLTNLMYCNSAKTQCGPFKIGGKSVKINYGDCIGAGWKCACDTFKRFVAPGKEDWLRYSVPVSDDNCKETDPKYLE